MADILIRGMEMPKHCIDCPLMVDRFDTDACALQSQEANEEFESWDDMRRGCPLVPLPEGHGRLIDADAFKAMCLSATKEAKPDFIRHEDWLRSCAVTLSFCRDIDERPTIVPAEGGGEDG